jgi:hypothetical protein
MARSVEELRLESERSRAEFAATVDQLRGRLSNTAEDLRRKVSPQHIKAEVSDYISDKTHGWLGSLKQQAMDNPLQTIAASATVAVPMLRLARSFPLPLLMITAGLAWTSKTLRGRAAEAAGPTMDKAGEMMNQAADRAQAFVGSVKDTVSSAQSQATDLVNDAQSTAGNLADDVSTRTANATGALNDNIKSGFDAAKEKISSARSSAKDTIDAARDTAAAAPEKARRVIGDNAALIGGLGVAVGAIIAAALPKTEAEAKIMGGASDSVRQTANEAAQSGFAAAKDKAMAAADAATESVVESDLGAHATRMTENVAGSLKEAAEDVAAAALNPSRTSNTRK